MKKNKIKYPEAINNKITQKRNEIYFELFQAEKDIMHLIWNK